jgi:hypothetical protein
MTPGSDKCRDIPNPEDAKGGDAEDSEGRERKNPKGGDRMSEFGTAVRVLLLLWDVVRTVIDGHPFLGAGPGRL